MLNSDHRETDAACRRIAAWPEVLACLKLLERKGLGAALVLWPAQTEPAPQASVVLAKGPESCDEIATALEHAAATVRGDGGAPRVLEIHDTPQAEDN